jgi:hypothetical protein
VNEKDMRKLAEIQRLIEAEIEQVPLPESVGKGPEFAIHSKPKNKKPFHNKRRPAKKE